MLFWLTTLLLTVSIARAQVDNLPAMRLSVPPSPSDFGLKNQSSSQQLSTPDWILAQASPASSAVSSQAVINQPNTPSPSGERPPTRSNPKPPSTTSPLPAQKRVLDPLLDTLRPKDCQVVLESAQTIACSEIVVSLPAGTYKQIQIMESPNERRADTWGHLKPHEAGQGYIRYLSDTPLKIDGYARDGGLDIPILTSDHLPTRIWYRKMKDPDDLTKAFSFILPPVALIAGAGAWSSGNILLPDTPPLFTEYRDYYVKPPKPAPNTNDIPKPSHVRPLGTLTTPGASNIRSK